MKLVSISFPLPVWFAGTQDILNLCLPLYSGWSRGQLRSVCVGACGSERPPRGAALPVKACRLELHFLLWPEGGDQEPGSAAGSDSSSQQGPHRGQLHTYTHTFIMLSVSESWKYIYQRSVFDCVCVDGVIPSWSSGGRRGREGKTRDQHIWQSVGGDRYHKNCLL